MRAIALLLGLFWPIAAVAQPVLFPPPYANQFFPGASVDLNFATQQFLPSTALSRITETRGSIATQDGLDGTWYQFSPGQFRFTSKGHLHEEARTNSIRSNQTSSNWTLTPANNVTFTAGASFVAQGITFIPITVSGTANASSTVCNILLEATTQIAALQNQVWSESAFISTSGTVPALLLDVNERSNVGASLNDNQTSISPTGTNARFQTTALLSNVSTAFTVPQLCVTTVNTTAYSGTINLGWPQHEVNPSATLATQGFASSPIPTTTGAVTRQADSATMPLPAGACNAGGCSLWAQFTPISPPIYPMYREPAQVDDGTNNNRVFLSEITASGFGFYGEAISSVITTQTISTAFSQNIQSKAAMFATATGFQPMQNGVLGTITSVAGPAAVSKLRIGGDATGSYCDCYIQRIAVAPTSLLGN